MSEPSPYPLPEDPALAAICAALNAAGHWAWVMDDRWRLVYATDAMRITYSGNVGMAAMAIGSHALGPEALRASALFRFGPNTPEHMATVLAGLGGWMLADTPGGARELREQVDPALRPVVDRLQPRDGDALWFTAEGWGLAEEVHVPAVGLRVRRADGALAGTALVLKPAPSMAILGALLSIGDLRHLEQMQRVGRAGRRPGAILFADLEGSSALARRLPTATYFALGRRIVRACDRCVVDAGGLVGRHVGDGVGALFLAESAGSESAAARACITAARELRAALGDVAERSDLVPGDLVLRFGLHWGSKLYVGAVTTAGRAEVTALGDEANEAARIEACANGGRALASKDLIERLDPADAAALGIDPYGMAYTALSALSTATEKARRDAPALSVCEV